MGTWTNSDGLHIKFGTDEAKSGHRIGEVEGPGPYTTVTIDLDWTALTETETVLNDAFILPNDAWLVGLEMITQVAVVGDSELDLGTISRDRTELDYNGLIAVLEEADASTVGERVVLWAPAYESTALTGSGAIGAQMGTQLGESCYISASNASATAFTAGRTTFFLTYLAAGIQVGI